LLESIIYTTNLLLSIRRKYKLWVIIDLHAAPGSQNGYEHSASRDGSQEWGSTDASIAQTVQVIDFLASRSVISHYSSQ
jgi:aryl-phospho-beta-D-glucosidase BglC (GH1 family)